ncbi:MAG: hypothetical protein KAT68_01410 [Bacteroidales bacterium]|nr:hypothetical protein [Bacteroidales bacterium]
MEGIRRSIEDACFLWENERKESAFLLVMVAVASLSKLRYSNLRDGEAFRKILHDFNTVRISVEFRGELQTIEQVFYKWVRCYLVHESNIPIDIQFQEDKEIGIMSVRAGGAPEYMLKLGTGWFFHFVESVLQSEEVKTPVNKKQTPLEQAFIQILSIFE